MSLIDGLTEGDLGVKTETPEQIAAAKAASEAAAAAQAKTDAEAATAAAEAAKVTAEKAKEFGGTGFDNEGNVVDATGKIVKTKQEIEKSRQIAGVEVNGIKFKLDDKGNAVDETGKIVHTVEELDELLNPEIPLVDELVTKLGYQFKDENGKPIQFEDSPEGIIELVNKASDFKTVQAQKDFFNAFPQVKDFAEYIIRNGSAEGYHERLAQSWRNVKFDDTNKELQRAVVITELIEKGVPKDQAEFTAKSYEDTNKLKEFSKASYDRLVQDEINIEKTEKENYAKQQELDRQEAQKYWGQVKEVITKGNVHNFIIPEIDRQSFYNYIGQAVDDNGNSQEILDRLTLEQELALKYLKFKKFDLSKLIASGVSNQRATSLRDRVKKGAGGLGDGQGVNKGNYTKPADMDISLEKLNN